DPLVTGVQTCALPIFHAQERGRGPGLSYRDLHRGTARGTDRAAPGADELASRPRRETQRHLAREPEGAQTYRGDLRLDEDHRQQIGRASCRESERTSG